MLTKQYPPMSKDTKIGLRATRAAIQEYGDVNSVPVTLNLVIAVENSGMMYNEHSRQEQLKKEHTGKIES